MTPRRWVRIAIAISLGAALATLPALPAVGQEVFATVEIGDTATQAGPDAGLLVTVTVTCPVDSLGNTFLHLFVDQTRGRKGRAFGFGSVSNFDCTGEPQEIIVSVTASVGPFRPGTASAQAELFVCAHDQCTMATDAEEITVVRLDTEAAA